jgi:uncharacterized protein YutE (UPF0331/DUF86 family)
MTGLNNDKLYSKFRDIRESIDRLTAFKDIPLEEFLNDQDKQDIASFRLIVATEAAIDMCMHISAKVFKKVPEDYAGCFKFLFDHGLIDQDLSNRLGRMARFRNLLVHQYWEIDYSRMYEIITGSDVRDLEELIRQINQWIKTEVDTK